MKRKKLSRGASKRVFRAGTKVKSLNRPILMRGGRRI